MKQLFFLIIIICSVFISAHAQTGSVPQQINYQGVARNAQGQPLANQNIKVRASLQIQGASDVSPATFYSEVRTLTTNQLGLFSFQINGQGKTSYTGSVYHSGWLNPDNTFFLKIELDVNNSGTYTDMGAQQIVSVPYAWYADRAMTASFLSTNPEMFQAKSTSGQTVAANAVATTVSFENEEFDNNGGYNPATGEYTVYVPGYYHFYAQVRVSHSGTPGANEAFWLYLEVDNVVKNAVLIHTEKETTGTINANVYLANGGKVKIDIQPVNGTGTLTVGANGSTYFGGFHVR